MAKPILDEDLWESIQPLLPSRTPRLNGRGLRLGRPVLSDRQALTGILFVLKTGIPWEYLPLEMGCGSGMSCWTSTSSVESRRLRDWHGAGVWRKLHRV